jgi:DNA repair protein RecN (Recombination protein N)
MLQKLRIEHLVLVDVCEISLGKGFHVITGETGSGKSVLLTAIGLLLGEKAEVSAIRHGEKMAVIEGEFSLPLSAHTLLNEIDITPEGETCTLRREILSTGKTRAFIDSHLVPLGFLKRLGSILIEISDQHASLTLKREETPRHLVDTFGGLESLAIQFQKSYHYLRDLMAKKELLTAQEPLREKEIEHLTAQIEEIRASSILTLDDNSLFHRLKELEHTKEAFEIASSMLSEIETGRTPLQNALFRLTRRAEKLSTLNSSYLPVVELVNTACTSIREAACELQHHVSSLDHPDEERLVIEAQLKRIDALKRLYGTSTEEIFAAKERMEMQIAVLTARDLEMERIGDEITSTQATLDSLAATLTLQRTRTAQRLQPMIQDHLRRLNMPNAIFEITLSPSSRSATGEDSIHFFITPNVGEKKLNVGEGASGGELARVFLAIQAVFADLFSIPTILFDEIDASIGGITANAVGKTLAAISTKRQVIAVTHFAQVATKATLHFALSKKEAEGRTLTTVRQLLTQEDKLQEHQRMIGSEIDEPTDRAVSRA